MAHLIQSVNSAQGFPQSGICPGLSQSRPGNGHTSTRHTPNQFDRRTLDRGISGREIRLLGWIKPTGTQSSSQVQQQDAGRQSNRDVMRNGAGRIDHQECHSRANCSRSYRQIRGWLVRCFRNYFSPVAVSLWQLTTTAGLKVQPRSAPFSPGYLLQCSRGNQSGCKAGCLMQAAGSVQFKENTGFCLLCNEWKLLLRDTFSFGGSRSKAASSYCISCDNQLRESSGFLYGTESNVKEGEWVEGQAERIAAHEARIQGELAQIAERAAQERAARNQAKLKAQEEKAAKQATIKFNKITTVKRASLQRNSARRRAS